MSGDTVTRPDGRIYKSRKVIAHIVGDEDEIPSMVLVLGTHDIVRAQPLADHVARMYTEPGCVAAKPETGWWRESIRDGRPWWVDDDRRGRAGVMFREITEVPGGH